VCVCMYVCVFIQAPGLPAAMREEDWQDCDTQ
jgi:hypothetical protein